VKYDQHIVNQAMVDTRNQGLSIRLSKSGSRTAKFDATPTEKLGLNDKQAAVLAELLLRGPQTPGELRQRTTRMIDFPDLEVLEKVIESMASGRSEPLIVKLPLQPGRREARYAHTLCGPIDLESLATEAPTPTESGSRLKERVAELYLQVAELTERLAKLEESA